MIVKIRITDFLDHPNQKELRFGHNVESVITVLQGDIGQNGLREPPTVGPDQRTIIEGHKRIEACRRLFAAGALCWEYIECEVKDASERELELLHVRSNTARSGLRFDQRIAIYRKFAPDLLKSKRLPRLRVDEVAILVSINAHTVLKDIQKHKNPPQPDLTIDQVRDAWSNKGRGSVKINIVDTAEGFILQAMGKNFKYESGPDTIQKVYRDSYAKATSGYFDRSLKDGNVSAGSRIRQIRNQLNLTQTKMAKRLGLSQSYYAELEAGKYDAATDVLEEAERILAEDS